MGRRCRAPSGPEKQIGCRAFSSSFKSNSEEGGGGIEELLGGGGERVKKVWTCLAKTAMSSLKESEEQTSPPATPGSRGVQVASSHFSKTSANRGNNGCLTGSAAQRHTHGDGVQRGRSKNCNQQVWRVCIPSSIQQARNTLHPQSAEPGPQTERKQPGLFPGFTGLFRSVPRSPPATLAHQVNIYSVGK